MVNTVIKLPTQSEQARSRLARVNAMRKRPGVRVEPRDDDMRRLMKHPRAGGFRSEGSIEWPNDTFTQRRLREGSVKLAEEKKEEPHQRRRHPSPTE